MSVKQVTMYTIICDRCGADACADTDYSCWNEPDTAREMCCDEWMEVDDKDYCPNCITWDDNQDKPTPKP